MRKQHEHSTTNTTRRLGRYSVVTVAAILANLGTYWALLVPGGWSAASANLTAAVGVIAVRSVVYELWVWRGERSVSLARRVVAYVSASAFGVALSTSLAWTLDRFDVAASVLIIGNLATYAVVWGVRFLVIEAMVGDREPSGPVLVRPGSE